MSVSEFFVIVDVGCIECGEDTRALGVFAEYQGTRARREYDRLVRAIGKEPPTGETDEAPLYVGYFAGGQRSLELHRGVPGDAA